MRVSAAVSVAVAPGFHSGGLRGREGMIRCGAVLITIRIGTESRRCMMAQEVTA
jgi:hypothetical protein